MGETETIFGFTEGWQLIRTDTMQIFEITREELEKYMSIKGFYTKNDHGNLVVNWPKG